MAQTCFGSNGRFCPTMHPLFLGALGFDGGKLDIGHELSSVRLSHSKRRQRVDRLILSDLPNGWFQTPSHTTMLYHRKAVLSAERTYSGMVDAALRRMAALALCGNAFFSELAEAASKYTAASAAMQQEVRTEVSRRWTFKPVFGIFRTSTEGIGAGLGWHRGR